MNAVNRSQAYASGIKAKPNVERSALLDVDIKEPAKGLFDENKRKKIAKNMSII